MGAVADGFGSRGLRTPFKSWAHSHGTTLGRTILEMTGKTGTEGIVSSQTIPVTCKTCLSNRESRKRMPPGRHHPPVRIDRKLTILLTFYDCEKTPRFGLVSVEFLVHMRCLHGFGVNQTMEYCFWAVWLFYYCFRA